MELSDFQKRLLGFPQQAFGAVIADPNAPPEQQDMANARMDTLGQMGAVLLAAGQRQSPQSRAAILSRLASVDSPDTLAMNSAQRRLYGMKMQQAQTEMQRQDALRQKLSDPAFLQGLGVNPQIAEVMGPDGVAELLTKRAGMNPLDDELKRAQIQHYLRPPASAGPTPQMVDLPGGGKGWATPGSTDVIPIGGAGKGGVDPEMAKRSENEDKNLTYAKEAIAANRILADRKYSGELTSGWNKRLNMIPAMNGSWAGDKYLTGDAQANSFVDSVVRPRSGAVVGPTEMADKKRIFTPMPGDTPEQLASKAIQRAQHIQSLIAGSNPADRPMLQQLYEDSVKELQAIYPEVVGGASAAPAAPSIPQSAVSHLKANPSLREAFDQKYGPGSAAKVLGQ